MPAPATFEASLSKSVNLGDVTPASDVLAAAASDVAFASVISLPAAEGVADRRVRVHVELEITSSGSAVTVTIRLKLGSTTICTLLTMAIANSQTAVPMAVDFDILIQEVGDTGDVTAWGRAISAALTDKVHLAAVTTTEVDNNAAANLVLSAESSAATGGNSVKLTAITAEIVR